MANYCSECGQVLNGSAKFCSNCGQPAAIANPPPVDTRVHTAAGSPDTNAHRAPHQASSAESTGSTHNASQISAFDYASRVVGQGGLTVAILMIILLTIDFGPNMHQNASYNPYRSDSLHSLAVGLFGLTLLCIPITLVMSILLLTRLMRNPRAAIVIANILSLSCIGAMLVVGGLEKIELGWAGKATGLLVGCWMLMADGQWQGAKRLTGPKYVPPR